MEGLVCSICKCSDWENIDSFRPSPENMVMCRTCGFVTYKKWESYDKYVAHYLENNYRTVPGPGNYYSGITKNYYHAEFLGPLFNRWKNEKKESPNICDVGAALGMFLSFCRNVFPKSGVSGTEIDDNYRKVALHKYGLYLTREVDTTKKYDLISLYKVLEHMPEAHKQLEKYVDCLNSDGRMYISVPTWLGSLFVSGGHVPVSFLAYYDPAHLNSWTKEQFKKMLFDCGLEIEKEDEFIYSYTALCKKRTSKAKDPGITNYSEIMPKFKKATKAIYAYEQQRFQDAISLWPDFPEAWINLYEFRRKELHEEGWEAIEKFIKDELKACPTSVESILHAADAHFRYNFFDESIKYLEQALKLRPCDQRALSMLATTIRVKGNILHDQQKYDAAIYHSRKALELQNFIESRFPNKLSECLDHSYKDCIRIPLVEKNPR